MPTLIAISQALARLRKHSFRIVGDAGARRFGDRVAVVHPPEEGVGVEKESHQT
jgi:hypothetical protein